MTQEEIYFLSSLETKLWASANKLLPNLDAARYKHVMLGLVFLKYVVGTIPFTHATLGSKDILGHVYEYFLGEFASAEGKKGGQFYTPKSIVSLIVEILKPYDGRVYDPAMGSGGFFVQSEKFIEAHSDRRGAISVYGQESNSTTWRLAAMNMAIRGIDFNFGGEPANTFTRDLHPDLRADFVMANPPFNQDEWWDEKLANDRRWTGFPTPPRRNANFAWMLHMLSHLNDNGSLGLLLANGSMSLATNGEDEIRRKLLEQDLVECMIALPGQLFTNTQIPACIWFLTKNKKARTTPAGTYRDRRGEVLFIDARNLGRMISRVQRIFDDADIQNISTTVDAWKLGKGYEDKPDFCKSATIVDLSKNDYVLTPGRYVGSADVEEDTEPFAEKMERLTTQLGKQFAEGERLEAEIRTQRDSFGCRTSAGCFFIPTAYK